jgi:hypothetical protein
MKTESPFQSFRPFNRFASFTTGISPFQAFQLFNRFAPFKTLKFRNQESGNVKDVGCFASPAALNKIQSIAYNLSAVYAALSGPSCLTWWRRECHNT